MAFKVAVCAGHGGFGVTPGKRSPANEYEWDFNNKVVLAFIKELSKYQNVEVRRYDDPTGKTDVPLTTRTNGANAWKADIYISFHHNAHLGVWGTHGGIETFRGSSADSIRLANLVHPEMVKAYDLRDRGIKTASLHITSRAAMPVILVEGGFMDSTTDIVKLRDNKVLENAGIGVAKAVATYGKLVLKPVAQPTPTKPTQGDDDQLKLVQWQWDMITKNLKQMHEDGILSSDEWVIKAQKKELTQSELIFLNNVIVTRRLTK